MTEPRQTDDVIRRYLLGGLNGYELKRLEQRMFSEEGYLEQIELDGEALIEDYLDQQLSPSDQIAFDQHFLKLPNHRSRYEFALDLRRRYTTADTPHLQSIDKPYVERWWTRFPLASPVAAAALLVVSGMALYFGLEANRESKTIARLEAEKALNSRRIEQLTADIARERAQAADRERAQKPVPPRALASMVIATLFPGNWRGNPARVPVVELPAGVSTVRLELRPDSPIGAGRASVNLKNSRGELIWTGSVSAPAPRVDIPAALLHDQSYILTLSAPQAHGHPTVTDFSFRFKLK